MCIFIQFASVQENNDLYADQSVFGYTYYVMHVRYILYIYKFQCKSQ